jgi:hypothetical protein
MLPERLQGQEAVKKLALASTDELLRWRDRE